MYGDGRVTLASISALPAASAGKSPIEEVVQRLTAQLGCEVEITLEIDARHQTGFDESTVRTVSENSRTLKFEHFGLEEG